MTDTFKQNLFSWALSFMGVALLSMIGWVIKISIEITDLQAYAKETDRVRGSVGVVKDQLRDFKVEMASIRAFRDTLLAFETRLELQSARLAGHKNNYWHEQTGRDLTELRIKLENAIKAAKENKEQIYTMVDRATKLTQKQVDDIARLLGQSENQIYAEIQSLRETSNTMLKQFFVRHGGQVIVNPK